MDWSYYIAGYLEQEYGDKQKAWSYTMVIVGLIMAALTIYNFFLHLEQKRQNEGREIVRAKSKFWFCQFFKKTNWVCASLYIIICLRESQLKMLAFLYRWQKCWWNGPNSQDVGIIYGTLMISLTVGGTEWCL
jgi:PAT family beta-lactamase induction signal transducer AmpG